MKRLLISCLGCWLLLSASGAPGAEVELSPLFGYRFGGSLEDGEGGDMDLKAGPAYGLALDFGPRDSDYKLELLWSRQESGLDLEEAGGSNDTDVRVDEFMFGCVYELRQGRFRECFTGLVGASVFDPEGADAEVRFGVSLGACAKYDLLHNLTLRADLRGYCNIVEAQGAFYSYGGSTIAYFSGSTLWQGEVSVALSLRF